MILHRGTQAFWVYLAAFVLVSLAYFSTATAIVAEWTYNSPYSHGLLALAISFWIVWEKSWQLKFSKQSHWLALAFVLLSALLWLAGAVSNTFLFASVGALGVLVGVCWYLFGWSGLLNLVPALSCIFLVLPIWGPLQGPLQQLSIDVTAFVLDLVGIPTLQEGIFFTVPGGKFAVEPACSGLGFFLCSVLLAIVYAHFNHLSVLRTARLILFAVLLALLSNWLRIIIIMLVGNATNMDHPIVDDHLFFGWIVFSVALVPFYWFAGLGSVAPGGEKPKPDSVSLVDHLGVANGLLILAVVCLPLLSNFLEESQKDVIGESDWVYSVFNSELGRGSVEGPTKVNPIFIGASEISERHYFLDGHPFAVLTVRYDHQKQGEELIFVDNSIYDADRWQVDFNVKAEPPVKLENIAKLHLLGSGNRRRDVYYWYLVGSYATSNALLAKLLEIPAFFQREPSVYQIAVVVNEPNPAITAEIENLLMEIFPRLETKNL